MNYEHIGTDIEETSRFRKKIYSKNKKFYEKIFTKNEIEYCLKKIDPYPHFTARFCAKEAVIKASNNKKLILTDIEISSKNGKPVLNSPFSGTLSLSHTKNYAIAVVLLNSIK